MESAILRAFSIETVHHAVAAFKATRSTITQQPHPQPQPALFTPRSATGAPGISLAMKPTRNAATFLTPLKVESHVAKTTGLSHDMDQQGELLTAASIESNNAAGRLSKQTTWAGSGPGPETAADLVFQGLPAHCGTPDDVNRQLLELVSGMASQLTSLRSEVEELKQQLRHPRHSSSGGHRQVGTGIDSVL